MEFDELLNSIDRREDNSPPTSPYTLGELISYTDAAKATVEIAGQTTSGIPALSTVIAGPGDSVVLLRPTGSIPMTIVGAYSPVNGPCAIQAVPSSVATHSHDSFTRLSFAETIFDNNDSRRPGVTTGFRARVDGLYLINARVTYESNSAGRRRITLTKNLGSGVFDAANEIASGTGGGTSGLVGAGVTHICRLEAGDFIEAWGYQASGGSLETRITGGRTEFMMKLLSF